MRQHFSIFALLLGTLVFDRTPGAHAAPVPPLRIQTLETAPLWYAGARGEMFLGVANENATARRYVARWWLRDDRNRAVRSGRIALEAAPGTNLQRIALGSALPLGPYELSAALETSVAGLAKSGSLAPTPQVYAAFAVLKRAPKKNSDVTLSALLLDGRARQLPAWLRESRLPISALAPEGDARFEDERARREERTLRREMRLETVLLARENRRGEANGDARFLTEDAARIAWARGENLALPLALDWPADKTLGAAQREDFATSAQALRALMAARRLGSTVDFGVVLPRETGNAGRDVLANTATAVAAQATRVLMPFDETVFNRDAARRISALATWNVLTKGARFERSLFASAPLLRGTSFTRGKERLALIWLERNANPKARLVARLDAEVFDAWGNELPRRKGVTVVPLGGGPVWVRSRSRDWNRAWQSASLEGARLLAVQVLPLQSAPRAGTKQLQVRLQNTGIAPLAGVLAVTPPRGWSLADEETNFRLAAGEAKVFRFAVAMSRPNAENEYPVAVEARRGASRWNWTQIARVALAGEVMRAPLIDAEHSEWADASWMRVGNGPVVSRLALKWDATQLYIAAVVREPQVSSDMSASEFWNRDAIQLAFGLRDDASVRPQSVPFRDTDYGFVLLPWRENEARLLRAWTPTSPFDGWNGRVRDRTRWGGAVPGARVALRRDAARGLTLYEASLPLSEMPTLRPARRAANALAVRFSFQVHSTEAPALSWSRANNVFAWWGNPVSFLGGGAPAAQVPLGFVALPPRELQELPPAAPPRPAPPPIVIVPPPPIAPEAQRAPETRTPPRRRPRPTPRETFSPPTLEPMKPHTLPPAAPPPGTPIPPAPAAR